MAAYKYGSVVIFNGREREKEVLKLCQEFCTEPTKQNYTEGKMCICVASITPLFLTFVQQWHIDSKHIYIYIYMYVRTASTAAWQFAKHMHCTA